MAKTPFVDLGSQNILSAHISGVQHSLNKVEEVLGMKTAAKTGHVLTAVADQADATLHNFIYEGSIRNWLNVPSPVVKRNGQIVPQNEYEIQPAYGVVVFNVQQDPADEITADFTHVTNDSSVIDNLDARVTNIEGGGSFRRYLLCSSFRCF